MVRQFYQNVQSQKRQKLHHTSWVAVKNHGIPEEIIQSALSASKEFFSLPIDKKMEVSVY